MSKKSNKKKINKKYLSAAVQLKHDKRNYLIQLIASVVIGAAWWAFVSFSGINDHSVVMSIVIFGGTVVIVIGVGIMGNRFARANTEMTKIKREYNITDEDIRNYERR